MDARDELVLLVDKPRHLSPVQAIARAKALDSSLASRRIGYAGRLDPLATGLLVLLLDERNRDAHEFNHLDKRYEVEVVFGLQTDSFDLLGLATLDAPVALDPLALDRAVAAMVGTRMQPYPPFSSVRIHGRPAFYWAHRNEVPEGGWPERERTVRSAAVLDRGTIAGEALVARAITDVNSVRGEFRQAALLARWSECEPALRGRALPWVRLAIECSSGTFMRSLAHELGRAVGTSAVATVIHRTQAGPFLLRDARGL